MNLRSRVQRLRKAADPVVVTLRCLDGRSFTRQELASLEPVTPMEHLVATEYYSAALAGFTTEELHEIARDEVPETPLTLAMARAGERAVLVLDGQIARGERPRLAEEMAEAV